MPGALVRPGGRVGAVILGSDFKALGMVRSLGRRGVPTVLVDDLPRSAWYSRYVVGRFRWRGAMWGEPFRSFLISLAERHQLHGWVLFPMQDEVVELVSRNTNLLSGSYRLVTPEWTVLRWAHNKHLLYGIAEELGVPYPKTWYPARERDIAEMPIQFPAIIKPTISVRLMHAIGRKALPADNYADLCLQYRAAAAIVPAEDIMVQEVIPGDGRSQYSVGAYCKLGAIHSAMTVRRRRQYPIDYGLSSSFVQAIPVPGLIELASRVLGRLHLSGMIEVEFKHDARDGLCKLLDVNVRPWGWHTLCIASGLDFPYLQYTDTLGDPIQPLTARYGYSWRRLITDMPAALHEMYRGITSPGAEVRSFLASKTVPSVLDYRDPLPVLGDFAIAVSRLLRAGSMGRSRIPRDQPAVRSVTPSPDVLRATPAANAVDAVLPVEPAVPTG